MSDLDGFIRIQVKLLVLTIIVPEGMLRVKKRQWEIREMAKQTNWGSFIAPGRPEKLKRIFPYWSDTQLGEALSMGLYYMDYDWDETPDSIIIEAFQELNDEFKLGLTFK